MTTGMALVLAASSVVADTFSSRMDEASWRVSASVFECRMAHEIPYFGAAVFNRRAGELPRFYLRGEARRLMAGEATITAVSPLWRQAPTAESLGTVAVKNGTVPISLDWQSSEKLLAELYQGKEIEIARQPWYDDDSLLTVKISNINFRGAYDKYLRCLGGLLPVNYDQVERTTVYFSEGAQDGLGARARHKLDNIITYAKADKSVKAFYIDGHTDSNGSRAENLALSRERAELVKSYLANRGVPPEDIALRWHGERYPVASNRTAKGRSLNRRVTIRLDKTPLPEDSGPEIQPMVAAPVDARKI